MKITETITRECCQPRKDLCPVEGSPLRGRQHEYVFCKHCGRCFEFHTFMDAAGSTDWDYKPLPRPWEKL